MNSVQFCLEHNSPIVCFDAKQVPYCSICLGQKMGMMSVEQRNEQSDEVINEAIQDNEKNKQILQNLKDCFLTYKQSTNRMLDKIVCILMDLIQKVECSTEELQAKIHSQNKSMEEVKSLYRNQQQYHEEVKTKIKDQMIEFEEKYCNISQFYDLLNSVITSNKKFQDQNQKPEYELIQQSSKKETNHCLSFAFNTQNNIIFIACYNTIIVYEFNNGLFGKELQRLTSHNDWVYSLQFMKQTNTLVSGGGDKSIIIWNMNQNGLWSVTQALKDHQKDVNCILTNNSENLIITGSDDQTVKFWLKEQDHWICDQSINTDNIVWEISLNDEQNKLIVCGSEPKISIIEQNNDKKWNLRQTIRVSESGYNLCFIYGNKFAFQPEAKNFLEIYYQDPGLNQFFMIDQQIQVQSCTDHYMFFPSQFVKSLNILIIKHGQFLNIFKVNEGNKYELIQTIDYGHRYLFGRVSDDGEYLITWDDASNEIQVRKFNKK